MCPGSAFHAWWWLPVMLSPDWLASLSLQQYMIQAVLLIWAFATLPQTILAVSFWVVMNEVAGPTHRYELMSRRWSILGLTTAVTTLIAGQMLDAIAFPLNYQILFLFLSVGGLVSYYFSSHIRIPDVEPPPRESGVSARRQASNYVALVKGQPDFLSFLSKRFIFQMGILLATPLLPLFYVRELNASNAWIGFINTVQACLLLFGYFWWTRVSRTARLTHRSIMDDLGIIHLSSPGGCESRCCDRCPPDSACQYLSGWHRPGFLRRADENDTDPVQRHLRIHRPERSKSCRGHCADGGLFHCYTGGSPHGAGRQLPGALCRLRLLCPA